MRRSILKILVFACITGLTGQAQSFQTSFSEVKFDRAKGPTTLHGGVEVDAASGAASLSIPLGPGIGARGVTYVPTLNGRFAPQVKVDFFAVNASNGYAYGPGLQATTGFELTPGTVDWFIGGLVVGSKSDGFMSNWTLPDGTSSTRSQESCHPG